MLWKISPARPRHIVLELVIALCLAFLVWLYTYSRTREVIDQAPLPVQVQLTPAQRENYSLEIQGTPKVDVSFSGPSSRLRELRRKLQRGQIQIPVVYTVPKEKFSEATYLANLRVTPDLIPVPPGVAVEWVDENAAIPITVNRISERPVPVKLETTSDMRVSQVKIEPTTVMVRGPKILVDRLTYLPTQPLSPQVNMDPESTSEMNLREQVSVVAEVEGRALFVNPRVVQVRCVATPKMKVYELSELPVLFLAPANFPYKPRFESEKGAKVKIRVLGPVLEEAPPVQVYVDLSSRAFSRGRNVEPVRLQLPKDFTAVQASIPTVSFLLEDTETFKLTSQQREPKSETEAPSR